MEELDIQDELLKIKRDLASIGIVLGITALVLLYHIYKHSESSHPKKEKGLQ